VADKTRKLWRATSFKRYGKIKRRFIRISREAFLLTPDFTCHGCWMKEFTLHPKNFSVNKQLLQLIEKHALSAPDREVCGFVYPDRYPPLANRSANPNRFEADPAEVASLL